MNEQELFETIKHYLVPDLEMSSNQFSKWDATTEKFRYFIEFKSRATHYDDLLLEKKKYTALVAKATATGYVPVYINSTPEGIFIFRLDLITPRWEERDMPVSTQFGNRQKIKKTVAFLKCSEASTSFYLPKPGDTKLTNIEYV